MIFFIYFTYILASIIFNDIYINVTPKKSILHWPEDLFQICFTFWLSFHFYDLTWKALFCTLDLFAIYWLIFDPLLNLARGKEHDYLSDKWYDQILPSSYAARFLIKFGLIFVFTIGFLLT